MSKSAEDVKGTASAGDNCLVRVFHCSQIFVTWTLPFLCKCLLLVSHAFFLWCCWEFTLVCYGLCAEPLFFSESWLRRPLRAYMFLLLFGFATWFLSEKQQVTSERRYSLRQGWLFRVRVSCKRHREVLLSNWYDNVISVTRNSVLRHNALVCKKLRNIVYKQVMDASVTDNENT